MAAEQHLQVELENSRTIHALKDEVADIRSEFSREIGEVRTDIARMPGKIASDVIQQIETHHPIGQSSREAKWALTLMITIMVSLATLGTSIIGALFLIMKEGDRTVTELMVAKAEAQIARIEGHSLKFDLHSSAQDQLVDDLQLELKQLQSYIRNHEVISAREHGQFETQLKIMNERFQNAHQILHENTLSRQIKSIQVETNGMLHGGHP